MHPNKLVLSTVIAFLALTLCASYAVADSIITYNLDWNNANNDTLYGGGNYGTVTVDLTKAGTQTAPGTAIITFSDPSNKGYWAAGGPLAGVNANGLSATISNINVTGGTNGVLGDISARYNSTFDSLSNPFSDWLYDSESESGWGSSAVGFSTVSFTLTNTSSTNWTSASNVLANTAAPYDHFIGAQILISTDWTSLIVDSNPNDSPGTTGSAPVPEPTTMLLLGIGLIGVAGVRRKVKT